MTKQQRITLMADWWPKACRAQGWNPADKPKRMEVLSRAVGRNLESANELNNREDIDAVKAHLGFLADNVAATIETDAPEIGRARRLRVQIREQLKLLGVYVADPAAYLAEILKDKFRHGARVMPLTIDDLNAQTRTYTNRYGKLLEAPSQLDQVIMSMARSIQKYRKEARDTIHDMKLKAGVKCTCVPCCKARAFARVEYGTNPLPDGVEETPELETMPEVVLEGLAPNEPEDEGDPF